jgi:hypothetical protein
MEKASGGSKPMHDKEAAALSRRQLVGGAGVGIAAAAAGPALALPQIQPTSSEPVMDDPRSCLVPATNASFTGRQVKMLHEA